MSDDFTPRNAAAYMRYVPVEVMLERIKNMPKQVAKKEPKEEPIVEVGSSISTRDGVLLSDLRKDLSDIAKTDPKLADACKALSKKIGEIDKKNGNDGLVTSDELAETCSKYKEGSKEMSALDILADKVDKRMAHSR